jgi:hypothetical protein
MSDKDVMTSVRNINKLYREATKHPSPAAWKAYYAALNVLQQNATQLQMQVAQQYLNTDVANTKKAAKDKEKTVKESVQKAQAIYTNAAQSLQSMYQSLFQRNESAMGQLFSGPFVQSPRTQNRLQWGQKLTGKDLLKDIKSQVSQFRQWRRVLRQLRAKGAPFELLQQIEAAGPSTLPEVRALLELNKADTRDYFKMFRVERGLIEVATQQDLKLQLGHYRKFGSNIALAILQGLRDEKTPMLNYFKNLVRDMFPGLMKAARDKAKGVTKGDVTDHTTAAKPPKPGHGKPVTKTSPAPTKYTGTAGARGYGLVRDVTYVVNTKETDVSTALNKAKTYHKATYGGPH